MIIINYIFLKYKNLYSVQVKKLSRRPTCELGQLVAANYISQLEQSKLSITYVYVILYYINVKYNSI